MPVFKPTHKLSSQVDRQYDWQGGDSYDWQQEDHMMQKGQVVNSVHAASGFDFFLTETHTDIHL